MLIDLFLIWTFTFFVAGLGRRIVRRLTPAALSPWVEFNLALLTGLVLLAFVMLGVGAVGGLNWMGMGCVLVGLSLLGFAGGKYYFFICLTWLRGLRATRLLRLGWLGSLTRIILSLIAVLFLVVLIGALGPPVGWDALNYHLAVPDLYRLAGRITLTPSILHSHYPQLVHMLYLFFLMLGRDTLPALLNTLLGGLFLMEFYRYLRARLGADTAAFGLGVMGSIPLLWFVLPGGHIEPAALWAMWWLWWAFSHRREMPGLAQLMGAVSAVFLLGSKYSHWVFVAAMVLVWLWSERRTWRQQAPRLALMATLVTLLTLPWLAKNWVETGNPIYPYHLTAKGLSTAESNPNMAVVAGQLPSTPSAAWWDKPLSLMSLPVRMTFLPRSLGGDEPKIGPILLGLLPILGWYGWVGIRRRLPHSDDFKLPLGALAAWVAFSFASWALVLRLTRYLFPFFPLIGLLLVIAWFTLTERLAPRVRRFWRLAWYGLVMLALLYNLAIVVKAQARVVPVVLGLESREDYLRLAAEPLHPEQKLVPEYGIYARANALLEPSDRILLIGEQRGYYLEIPYVWGRPDLARSLRYFEIDSLDKAEAALTELGVTHLLYDRNFLMQSTRPAPTGITYAYQRGMGIIGDLVSRDCRELAAEGQYALCALP